MKKKIIGILICMLLIATTVLPVSGNIDVVSTSIPVSSGNTLYVGGTGPNNYTKIQDAINDSSDGDTVFVYDDSSPYYENVVVNKSITLKGENKKTTIIDGGNVGFVVHVLAPGVTITGFKVIKSGTGVEGYAGIRIYYASNCNISENIIEDNHYGIHAHYSAHCTIISNIIDNNFYFGISIGYSPYAYISKNKVTNTSLFGINIHSIQDSCICEMNHIERNGYTGIQLYESNSNIIRNNTFIRNKHNAYCVNSSNTWAGNYWNRPRILPKLIFGRKDPFDRFPNMVDFDRHPALKPYNILPLEV